MSIFKHKWMVLFAFIVVSMLSFGISKSDVKAIDMYGCTPNPVVISGPSDNETNYLNYLQQIGVPTTHNGYQANWQYGYNNCLLVYGGPSNVPGNTLGSNGQYYYLGFNQFGSPFLNPEYIDYKPQVNYYNIHPFHYQPWNLSLSPTPTNPSSVQPTYYDPSKGRVLTRSEELDRAVDRQYVEMCGSNCGKGNRGYLPDVNTALGVPLTGQYLQNYASVSLFPTDYTAGIFTVYYHSSSSGIEWYASSYIPPHKLIGDTPEDLKLTINSITPNSLVEGFQYDVNYSVCNLGSDPVSNPVVSYGLDTSESNSLTINRTIQPNGQCYTSDILQTAPHVVKDTIETMYMEVNKDHTNPVDEADYSNNKGQMNFTDIHRVIDYAVQNLSWSPTYPHSNQTITLNYQVCNKSNIPVNNVSYTIGFVGQTPITRTIPYMDVGQCITYSTDTLITPVVKDYTGTQNISLAVTSGPYFSEDINPNNNSITAPVTVRNPDAKVKVVIDQTSNNNVGDANVTVTSKMFSNITQNCSTSAAGCAGGGNPTTYSIQVYDTNFTSDTSDDRLVASFTPSYSLDNGQTSTFTIPNSTFSNWVASNYPNTFELVQFRIVAQIPDYGTEVDWFGNNLYTNNQDTNYFNYFPTTIDAGTQCAEVKSSITNYFDTTNGGFNPIKICAGNYPKFPSTSVENGMQAYNYVLYRFFPEPIPKYTVTTPVTNTSTPNHFYQFFSLPTTENSDQMGDFDSMFLPENLSNGYYQERGRYMPTGGTFDFQVYKKNSDGSNAQTIALGTVSYNIPSTCYESSKLDIKHQYGCDEILFFLPNPDNPNKMHQEPSNDTASPVTYPISNTKIPYLNPGSYSFSFKATENFHYYYQSNLINDGYKWGWPKFK